MTAATTLPMVRNRRRRTQPVRTTRLNPARPAAMILPAVVLYLGAIAVTGVVHALLIWEPSWLTFVRVALLAGIHIPVVFVVSAVAEGVGGDRFRRVWLPWVSLLLAVVIDALLPGTFLHPVTLLSVALLSVVVPPLACLWRDWWVRHRPARVTLLASSEWGAREAIHRLEEIPGLEVSNVIIPDVEPQAAEALLRLPVRSEVHDDSGFERRVIVSCPRRDATVGATIATLVARGHVIDSESSILRAAEGRVDTDRADPLNLLLGRPTHWISNAASRVMDLLLAAALLIVLAPVFLLVALAIKLNSPGPVFYRQRRMGARGQPFDVIKFRSMYVDAEARSGPVWAQENDPRITSVGRVLRRTRLDELPQLFNVVLGQMALVGPRPERPHFFHVLRRDVPLFELRTCVRPGITGWAQIRAPYAAGSEDARVKLSYDLFYVTRRSPWFDLAILFETVGVAFSGKGAR